MEEKGKKEKKKMPETSKPHIYSVTSKLFPDVLAAR